MASNAKSTIRAFLVVCQPFDTSSLKYPTLCHLHNSFRMSADNDSFSDSRFRSDFLSSFDQITKPSTSGMELSQSRHQSPQQPIEQSAESSNMSTLAIGRQPQLPSPSMMWDDRRQLDLPSRTRSPPERIELPSIGQVSRSFPGRTTCTNTFAGYTRDLFESQPNRGRIQARICGHVFPASRSWCNPHNNRTLTVTVVTQAKKAI